MDCIRLSMLPLGNSLTILQTGIKYLFYYPTHLMKYLAVLNGVAVDDAVLLQNRIFHLICSILVSKCSTRSNSENEYPYFMFLIINNEVIGV